MKSAKSATRPRSRSVERAASKPATESRRHTPIDLTGPNRTAPRSGASVELAGVLDNIPTSVLVLDRTGVIVWVNSAISNDFGCARESLLGRSLLQLIVDDEREHFQHWLTQVVAAESATQLSFEAYIHRADNLIDRGRFSGIYAAAQQQVIVTYYRLNVLEDADIDLSIRAARLEEMLKLYRGEFLKQRSPNTFLPNINGGYNFEVVGDPASDFSAFLSDTPALISLTDGPSKYNFKEWDMAYYFGDDWRIKDNLTIPCEPRVPSD